MTGINETAWRVLDDLMHGGAFDADAVRECIDEKLANMATFDGVIGFEDEDTPPTWMDLFSALEHGWSRSTVAASAQGDRDVVRGVVEYELSYFAFSSEDDYQRQIDGVTDRILRALDDPAQGASRLKKEISHDTT